jgi:hypothetical protein
MRQSGVVTSRSPKCAAGGGRWGGTPQCGPHGRFLDTCGLGVQRPVPTAAAAGGAGARKGEFVAERSPTSSETLATER